MNGKTIIGGAVVLALAGCGTATTSSTSTSSTPGSSAPAASAAAAASSPAASPAAHGTPVQGDPADPQTLDFTCTLGWQYYSTAGGGGTVGPLHPGPAPSANPTAAAKPADSWVVTVYNGNSQPVTLDWVQSTFYLNGKSAGGQDTQSDTAVTLNPGQSSNEWGGMINPANEPAATNLDTGYQIENQPGASCGVTDWGNASGQG